MRLDFRGRLAALGRALALAAAAALAASDRAFAAPEPGSGWFESDPSGLPGDPLDARSPAPPSKGYALRVEAGAARSLKTLYKDGQAFKAWLVEYGPRGLPSREYSEREGEPLEETLYDAEGRPAKNRAFLAGGSIEETEYRYVDGRLVSSLTTRDGAEQSSVSYVYAPDGRAVSVKEKGGGFIGQLRSVSGPSSSWRKGPDGLELRSYDAVGRLVEVVLYVGGSAVRTESREYRGRILAASTVASGDESVRSEYLLEGPGAGKPSLVVTERAGVRVSSVSTAYDGAGRVAKVERKGASGATTATYAYDEGGRLISEREESGGQAVVRLYSEDGSKVEESYGENGLFARVYFADGRRVREEMIVDGAVARVRSFE